MITTILFDADGTLLDTEDFIIAAFQHSLGQHNQPVPEASTLKGLLGPGLEVLYKTLAPNYSEIHALAETHREFQKTRVDLVIPFKATSDLLHDLAEHTLGMVTNRSTSIMPALQHLKIDEHFSVVVDGSIVTEMKPSPQGILHALRELNTAPTNAIMIGDTIYDIQAGKAAGVRTIAITHGSGTKEELEAASPDYIVHSLEEIAPLIKEINQLA